LVDPRILAARFFSPGPARHANIALDRVMVRDLTLDCEIGVYSREHGVTQRVRFSVEIECYPLAKPLDENIDNVISYDYIVDGIKGIVAQGHILLVETLVERVAEHCLKDRRAASVRVIAEKLDRIPGAALGVEIFRRQKAAHEANVYSLMLRMADKEQKPAAPGE
jgi:dihydroneopterin aldolase